MALRHVGKKSVEIVTLEHADVDLTLKILKFI